MVHTLPLFHGWYEDRYDRWWYQLERRASSELGGRNSTPDRAGNSLQPDAVGSLASDAAPGAASSAAPIPSSLHRQGGLGAPPPAPPQPPAAPSAFATVSSSTALMAAGLAEGTLPQPVVGSLAELSANAAARASGLGDSVGATAFGRMVAPREGSLRPLTSPLPSVRTPAAAGGAPSSPPGGTPSAALAGAPTEARAEEA
ncbi:hypothetical protein OAO87_00145 [bacterium]|nr:hypothetical protein [bacterium]